MGAEVVFEVATSHKETAASREFAGEGTFASVKPDVSFKIPFLAEGLATAIVRTLIWSLASLHF